MIMRNIISIIFCLSIVFARSQFNVDSLSRVNFVQLHDTYLNDVWGHVDITGKEYALVGARKGTSIVDVSDPENPNEIYWEDGVESIWRDVNTWQNYAYVTTEAESGLLIVDMNSLPNASGLTSKYYTGSIGNEWQSAHTMFIDSSGYAYIFGPNRGNGGVIILDIHTDPWNPIEVGVFDDWYCHDGFVQNDTMYLAHISEGFFSIVDISDKGNPVLLGTKITKNAFTHNMWTTPNGQFTFSTDEVSGAYVGAYDVSDPANIIELDLIQSSPGTGVIPHNVQWFNDFLVTSYYADGVAIFDATRPHNLVKVGQFDTYPTQTTGFDGCWSSYPYLPSGIVLAADITEGLFIGRPNYQKASFLEGFVKDESDNADLNNVLVSIENSDFTEKTKTNGFYATGVSGSKTVNVTYFKVGYFPKTISVNLVEGEVNFQDVLLTPIPKFPIIVNVFDAKTNLPILNANVRLNSSLTQDDKTTNGFGTCNFELFYTEEYQISVGKWTYKTNCFSKLIDQSTNTINVYLNKGIYDDFTFDFGWTSSFIGATKGLWERGKPNSTNGGSAPGFDSPIDCSDFAYVTGNDPSLNPDFDEVKDGTVLLYSPIFDLSNSNDTILHFDRWFFNLHGPGLVDDTLRVIVSNGITSVEVDKQGSDPATFYQWISRSLNIKEFIEPTQNMQIIVKTSDLEPNGNFTEAGFDNFYLDSVDHYKIGEIPISADFSIFPNPTKDELIIRGAEIGSQWELIDTQGKVIFKFKISSVEEKLNVLNLQKGIYFLRTVEDSYKIIKN